jgi:tRNA G10  N-methylase Trm11
LRNYSYVKAYWGITIVLKFFICFRGATLNLRAMCIWSIHDFLAYGPFARCVIKGLVGCPPYGLATKSRHSRKLKKVIYCGSRWYLPWTHPYRQVRSAFNGEMENRGALVWVTTLDTMKWVKEWEVWLQGPHNKYGSKHDHVHKHGIKRHSIMLTPILGSKYPLTKPLNHN